MSDFTFLYPILLLLLPVAVLLVVLPAFRLSAFSRVRRTLATVLQALSAALLVIALAQPVLAGVDPRYDLVVALDASNSLSPASRTAEIQYAQTVLHDAAAGQSVRFISVGKQAILLTPEDVASGQWASGSAQAFGSQRSTDLSAGLRLAGSLLGDEGRRRIVLATDGWETQGDVADEAQRLRSRGIDVQVVALNALGEHEVVVEALNMQSYARVGDPVPAELHIYSTQAVTATLSLLVDGTPAPSRVILLDKGENTLPLQQTAGVEGFHRVEAQVQTGAGVDTNTENNSAFAGLVVKPAPRALVLQERVAEGTLISHVLGQQGIEVDLGFPAAVPPRVEDLSQYDSIVLVDVAATSFTLDQQKTLQEYVRRYGRGLVAIGGETAFGKGDYADTVFDDMMPVSSQPAPRPQQGNIVLILVIDKSSSMRNSGDLSNRSSVDKFSMALRAAELAVDSLRSGDQVGVLAFDNAYEWAVPVQAITSDVDKNVIKGKILQIHLGNSTAIYAALAEAARAIRLIDVPNRHIVLLTDGMDQGYHDYTPLLESLRNDTIHLSTIGIGSDVRKDFLIQLARDGLGRYYFTEQPENLPKIVFKEIDLATREATLLGTVQPHIASLSPALNGLRPQDIPQLSGYDITQPKDAATTALLSDAGDPLLAHWQYGLGRVLAFTSEAGQGWGAQWASWSSFGAFWNQAVRWTMGSPESKVLQPSAQLAGGAGVTASVQQSSVISNTQTALVSVESLNADNSFADLASVTAGVKSPSGVVTSTTLLQTAPGHYEGQVPVGEPGSYEVLVHRAASGDIEAASEEIGLSVPPGAEYLHAGTNDLLLKRVNGGAAYYRPDEPAQALDASQLPGATRKNEPLWGWLFAPALILLIASVAVRRVDFRAGRRPVPSPQSPAPPDPQETPTEPEPPAEDNAFQEEEYIPR
ncbi:MAG: VWA domain-containing protein [Chloroflexota bacterium]